MNFSIFASLIQVILPWIMQAIGELFAKDLGAGITYYFWTVIGDGHIEDTIIQLYVSFSRVQLEERALHVQKWC